ncbi:MAG: hypothetical protein JWN37_203 [Candidatus Nomurabacteria bacterium]|nr:hypothetical protein [Candidatus Nomurabacteria bacterium]
MSIDYFDISCYTAIKSDFIRIRNHHGKRVWDYGCHAVRSRYLGVLCHPCWKPSAVDRSLDHRRGRSDSRSDVCCGGHKAENGCRGRFILQEVKRAARYASRPDLFLKDKLEQKEIPYNMCASNSFVHIL